MEEAAVVLTIQPRGETSLLTSKNLMAQSWMKLLVTATVPSELPTMLAIKVTSLQSVRSLLTQQHQLLIMSTRLTTKMGFQ